MRISHRVSKNVTHQIQQEFQAIGVDLPIGLSTIILYEDDVRWPNVARLKSKLNCLDIVSTVFSSSELNMANVLAMSPEWHHGYPMPDMDNGYFEATYDISSSCQVCRIGLSQKAPFRFRKAPSWGTKSILQLNWIFDEYFVKPEVWEDVFQPFGIGCRPAILHRSNAILENVVQLDVATVIELEMDHLDHPFEVCPVCNRKRYLPFTRGFLPKPKMPEIPMFKSTQYFGSGGSSSRLVFISNELYRKITLSRLKGASFSACVQ